MLQLSPLPQPPWCRHLQSEKCGSKEPKQEYTSEEANT